MKKIFFISVIAVLITGLSGCSNDDVPEGLNEAQAITVIGYNNNNFFNETSKTTTSPVTSTTSLTSSSVDEKELSVPENYKKINGDIYAVIESGEVTGYVKGSYDTKSKKWTWKKCDSEGKIITTTQKTTTTKSTTKKSTTTKTTTKTVQKTQSQTKQSTQTQPVQTQPPVTQPPSTQPPKTQTTKQTTTTKATTTRKTVTQKVTTTIKNEKFKWETISQGQCPIEVSNYFDNFIILKNPVFQQTNSNGYTYALLKAKYGQAIKINSVSSDGKIKFTITSSGSNYVIVKINQDIKVKYYQE